jgi:hypothetical protein
LLSIAANRRARPFDASRVPRKIGAIMGNAAVFALRPLYELLARQQTCRQH